jgi:two-component system sensor histidine kinase/response regulator
MTDQSAQPVLDLEVVESLKALDEDGGCGLFLELIDLFVHDAAAQLSTLQAALAAGDIKTVERTAHTLKSSSANIGASRLSGLCFELEKLGRAGKLDGVQSLVARTGEEYAQVCEVLASMRS